MKIYSYFFILSNISVVFKDQKCLDCAAKGDARLMPKHCHMEPVYTHPGNIVQYHPKGKWTTILLTNQFAHIKI